MNKYLIKLYPIDEFFFGAISNFGNENENYRIVSEKFPQQTSILGMLRKEILLKEDFLKKRYTSEEEIRVKNLIGAESFNISSDIKQEFGMIKSISALSLGKDKDTYIVAPMDLGLKTKEVAYKVINSSLNKVEIFDNYKAKNGVKNALLNISDKKTTEWDEVYIEKELVGINRKQEKNGFFKKVRYKLKDGFFFQFLLELDGEINENIVQLGDAKSFFKMTIEKKPENFDLFESCQKESLKATLLSDGYFENEFLNKAFSITNNRKFANWITKTNNYKFKTLEEIHNFYEKGSVFYFNTEEDKLQFIKNINEKYENVNQIGLNQII